MKRLVLLLLFLITVPAMAVTHHVNLTTGGSSLQCTGLGTTPNTATASEQWNAGTTYALGHQIVDLSNNLETVTTAGVSQTPHAPSWGATTVDGTVHWARGAAQPTGQPCPLNNPYWMATHNDAEGIGFTWTISAGDVIQFDDSATYPIGCALPNGPGTYWIAFVGGAADCILPQLPDNVTIRGVNAGACHDAGHTHLLNPTILTATNNITGMLKLGLTSGDDLECIEFTQPSNCTTVVGAAQCIPGTDNFVTAAGILLQNPGSTIAGPNNLVMHDILVVGLGASGILGSKLSGVTTTSDIYVIGNGTEGWNGDAGGCGTSCESTGTWNLSYLDTEWNGCVAVKPYNNALPASQNAYDHCYDDSSGGSGDGFVQIAAGALTLNITHSHFLHNAQDGLDALHLSDDITTSPITNLSTSWSEGNMGQTFKEGAGASASAINNFSNSNCRVMATASNFPLNPNGWNAALSDFCRASGDQWSFQLKNGSQLTLEANTSVGYGTTMYDLGCAAGALSCGSNGASVIFRNNINKGYPDPGNAGRLASGWFLEPGILSTTVTASFNLWNTMNTGCPDSTLTGETNFVCADPLLVAESNIDAINPNLTSSSPAIGAGTPISGITTDYNGNPRPNPPSIGAFELTGGGSTISGSVVLAGNVIIQ